jgi:hypothetical protein
MLKDKFQNKKLWTIFEYLLFIAGVLAIFYCFRIGAGMVKTYDELARILTEIDADDVQMRLEIKDTGVIDLPNLDYYDNLFDEIQADKDK